MSKLIASGFGYPDAKIMLVEECPSPDELLMGAPFCSLAGKHFANLLREAEVNRKSVYYTFAIRHNWHPYPASKFESEFEPYRKLLWDEIRSVRPKIIVALGTNVTKALLREKSRIRLGDVAGKPRQLDYFPAKCIPWYRPEWILRHGKKAADDTTALFKDYLTVLG